jgi:glutamyl-tRNA(Gln) amidotransferase subunit E
MVEFDYKKLGLMCGLEIHQQLDSKTKLFCRCPNDLEGTREPDFTIQRYMRPVLGEMGTYDEAMLTEYEKGMTIIYEGYNDVICTYELDETPPFESNNEARKIAIEIALLLNSNIIEEMHVCRKNYLDGSVPCGFQRTMILAKDGSIQLESGKKIGIDIICLEEDAARKIKTEDKTNFYRLDRLGIPLVEITTKPDISNPYECRDCAERLGLLLWTSKVKKVLGSIRQDVNVSIKAGSRVEIKGVQKLDWIPFLIDHEVSRQLKLIELKQELEKKKKFENDLDIERFDLSKIITHTKSDFITKGIKSGKKLYGINFSGFKGIFGKDLMENYRFGTEISSKVKSITGLKGLIHSDENLENYNFTNDEMTKIKAKLKSKDNDGFILVLGTKEEVEKACEIIIERVKFAFKGVPPETRRALEDGNTEFIRELHGGARLYPDTDSKAIINKQEEIKEIESNLPQYPWITIYDYSKKYKIEERLIKELIFMGNLNLFNILLEIYPDNPTLIITTLLETTTALRRDGKNVDNIKDMDFKNIFTLLKNNEIGKEAIAEILMMKADAPDLTIEQIKKKLKIESISIEDLRKIIDKVIKKTIGLIKEKEMRAMSPLMGEVMKEVRGKIDGAIVSQEVKKKLQEFLENKNV